MGAMPMNCENLQTEKLYLQNDLYLHSLNVALYSSILAKKIGFKAEKVKLIQKYSLIHDLGKLLVPDYILYKQDSLSKDEFNIIKKHPILGAKMAPEIGYDNPTGLAIIKYHHKYFNCTGYPAQKIINKTEIDIVTLADAFDAMFSERCYKKASDFYTIEAELHRCSGTQFNPELVPTFINLLKESFDINLLKNTDIFTTDTFQTKCLLKNKKLETEIARIKNYFFEFLYKLLKNENKIIKVLDVLNKEQLLQINL